MNTLTKLLTGVAIAALALTGCSKESTTDNAAEVEDTADSPENIDTNLQDVMDLQFFSVQIPSFGGHGTAKLLCDNDSRAFLQVHANRTLDVTRVEDYDTKCEDITVYL